MSDMPASNQIVTVSSGNGAVEYVDAFERMSYEDIVNCHGQGVMPDSVLLQHALYLLDESEARTVMIEKMLMALQEKVAALCK